MNLRFASTLVVLACLGLTFREGPAGADAASGRYTVTTGPGATVTDNQTGLVWSRAEVSGMFAWAAAQAQCTVPWRVPNIVELQTIMDETRATAPSIDTTAFWGPTASSLPSGMVWSSTPDALNPGSAWWVSFADDYAFRTVNTLELTVRCVR
jgi:hypothetical protein